MANDLAAFARRRRSFEQLLAETGHGEGGDLSRSLGFGALTLLSIGAMVGTGMFFVLATSGALYVVRFGSPRRRSELLAR
jgi:amino acid permease